MVQRQYAKTALLVISAQVVLQLLLYAKLVSMHQAIRQHAPTVQLVVSALNLGKCQSNVLQVLINLTLRKPFAVNAHQVTIVLLQL
jgi:hypothetical protein